jgi:hypothetical protein
MNTKNATFDNVDIFHVVIVRDRLADNGIVNAKLIREHEIPIVSGELKRAFHDVCHPMGMSPQDFFVEIYPLDTTVPVDIFLDGINYVGETDEI